VVQISTSNSTTTVAAPPTTTWTIDPSHSEVGFAVKHMMISSTKGRFSDVTGTITLDEQDLGRSRVEVEIGIASIDTRDEKRDAHLRSGDFFDAERWPTMTFRSTEIEPLGGSRLRITGDLTIRDTTTRITFAAGQTGRGTNPWGQEVIGFSADTKIRRQDYGLTWNVALETGGVLVGDEVKIHLDVEAVKSK
jgi:polyisoprenoid-binding protein YceI